MSKMPEAVTIVSKEPELVEVPLDPQYLTEEGMYKAGYIWGRHVRSPKSAPINAPLDFIKGVEDGYGSRMLEWDEELGRQKRNS